MAAPHVRLAASEAGRQAGEAAQAVRAGKAGSVGRQAGRQGRQGGQRGRMDEQASRQLSTYLLAYLCNQAAIHLAQ